MGYLREERGGKGGKSLILILKKLTFMVFRRIFCNFTVKNSRG